MIRFIRASWLFVRIFASYGLLWLLTRLFGRRRMAGWAERTHQRNAKRLYQGFLRLRGVYIKVGQVLSVLGSFLPQAFVDELQGLQDSVPPKPFRVIRRSLIEAHGKPPEETFASLSEEALAAASLGQVHRGTHHDGSPLAVKILYPNIDRIIRIDLRVLRWVFKVWQRIVPVANLSTVLDQLEDVLSRETNYKLEADNLERLSAKFADDDSVAFPVVYRDLSSRRVLVMSFMEGLKITDVDSYEAAGLDRTEVARLLVTSYYKQLLIDGLYHADPHPGNFLVRTGPQLVFLDFGAVEPVRDALRKGMITMLTGIIARDDDKALEGIEEMGFVAPNGDRELLNRTVRHYFTKLVTLKVADYGNMSIDQIVSKEELRAVRGQMRSLMRSVRYPEGYFYIERSLVLLFGLCATIDPHVNALELGFPYAMQFILKNAQQQGGDADGDSEPEPDDETHATA